MIDVTTKIRTARRRQKRYYPCIICHRNMVSRNGGRCMSCACKIREENYQKRGIKRPANRTFANTNIHLPESTKPTTGKRQGKNNGCVPHWMIDEKNFGVCLKFKVELCRDTGLPCPHDGVRDFAALQERHAKRFPFLESCKKGGVKSGRLRGGKRGRPRKIREVLT